MKDGVERIDVLPVELKMMICHSSRREQKLLHEIGNVELCPTAESGAL
jgi:hypothetical protein